jgi:hypothetical protein
LHAPDIQQELPAVGEGHAAILLSSLQNAPASSLIGTKLHISL